MRPHAPTPLPTACDTALKEWAGICQALRDGRQIVLLRKGGIAEEDGVFRPEQRVFWLYPTWTHEAEQGLRPGFQAVPPADHALIAIDLLAVVEGIEFVRDEASVRRIAPLTGWTTETLVRRYRYRLFGLWALTLRVYRRLVPWTLEVRPEHTGCRSWVTVNDPVAVGSVAPALSDTDQGARVDELAECLGREGRLP